jgi:hypothetical protein
MYVQDTVIECLPSCTSAENPPKFPPITYGSHLLKMYEKTYGDSVAHLVAPTLEDAA